MFDRNTFANYHNINTNRNIIQPKNKYDSYAVDAEGNSWGFIESLGLYEQADTGVRKDAQQFQLMNIDIVAHSYGGGDDRDDGGRSPRKLSQILKLAFGPGSGTPITTQPGGLAFGSVGDNILSPDHNAGAAGSGGGTDWAVFPGGTQLRLFPGSVMLEKGTNDGTTSVGESSVTNGYQHTGLSTTANKAATGAYFALFSGSVTLRSNVADTSSTDVDRALATVAGTLDLNNGGDNIAGSSQANYVNVTRRINHDGSFANHTTLDLDANSEDTYEFTLTITEN